MKCRISSPWGPIDLDDEVLIPYRELLEEQQEPSLQRLCYAATHIVLNDSYADCAHSLEHKASPEEIAPFIDWSTSMQLRSQLDDLGFGIAEAMDTAQRFDIGWHNASELIQRTGALGLTHGFVAGAGVDHLPTISSEQDLIDGVVYQARFIQEQGGIPILLPLPWLSLHHSTEDVYVRVYTSIIDALDGPLFLHWLGEMFLPSLAGYFPGQSFLRIMAHDPSKVRGAKLSLLDHDLELTLRRELLPQDQILLTGDDFHFADLMQGDLNQISPTPGSPARTTTIGKLTVPIGNFSHALLGIFDAIAEPASLALRFLALGDTTSYRALMQPCETLSRHLFATPTQHYKAGLAFLSWLNGHQPNAMLVNHEELARSPEHYVQAARLASQAGTLPDLRLIPARLQNLSS